MIRRTRILIVTADDNERSEMHQALERHGFEVVRAADYPRAYAELIESRFDVIVTECAGPAEGVEFIKRVRHAAQLTGILILVVAEWGAGEGTLALSQGADAYEPKPFDADRLIASIERLLLKRAAAAGQNQ